VVTVANETGNVDRLTALTPALEQYVAGQPGIPSMPMFLADVYVALGRTDEARRIAEADARGAYGVQQEDSSWLSYMTRLSEVITALDDAPRARAVYALLRPHAHRTVTVGVGAWVVRGVVAHFLGILATTILRGGTAAADMAATAGGTPPPTWEDAEHYLEQALAAHTRMGAAPLVARTQHAYATLLLLRGGAASARAHDLLAQAGTAARKLGMRRLAAQVSAVAHGNVGNRP
jgi:hypothetical protein